MCRCSSAVKPEVTKSWGAAGLVDGGNGAVARAGERPGALDDFVQHHLKVEARADAQARPR